MPRVFSLVEPTKNVVERTPGRTPEPPPRPLANEACLLGRFGPGNPDEVEAHGSGELLGSFSVTGRIHER